MIPDKMRILVPESRSRYRARLVPTDVVEARNVRKQHLNQFKDPIPNGCGLGRRGGSYGTFGCLVRDRATDDLLILSNHHVLFEPDNASDVAVMQPLAGSSNAVVVGDALRGWSSTETSPFHFDAAVASTDRTEREFTGRPICTGIVSPQGYATALEIFLGMKVNKCGARTGYSQGVISDIGDYDGVFPPYRQVLFIESDDPADPTICGKGDSGSIWLSRHQQNADGAAVGLHFAGTTNGHLAFAVPMWRVLEDEVLSIRL